MLSWEQKEKRNAYRAVGMEKERTEQTIMGEGNAMTERNGKARFMAAVLMLLLVVQARLTPALADDAELLRQLPGPWTYTGEEEDGEETRDVDRAFLELGEDGKLSMRCCDQDGAHMYTLEGTWSFELVADGMDRLTLVFTGTDDPARAGEAYRVECVYDIYAEGWDEDDVQNTWCILEPVSCSGVSPFEELSGFDGAALHREQGPNMRVVNCKESVSLREKRSKTSARLAKVPLGALVLAFPDAGEENGFFFCMYHNQYGYILAEYLAPVE